MDEAERYEQVYKPELRDINIKLDKLLKAFFEGNGKAPVIVQLDRLNRFKNVSCWFIGACVLALLSIFARWAYISLAS